MNYIDFPQYDNYMSILRRSKNNEEVILEYEGDKLYSYSVESKRQVISHLAVFFK